MTTDKPMPEWNATNIQTAIIMATGTEEQQAQAREFFGHYLLGMDWRPTPLLLIYHFKRTDHVDWDETFEMIILAASAADATKIRDDKLTKSSVEEDTLHEYQWVFEQIGTAKSGSKPGLLVHNFRAS